jgi:hypothetical protein
MATSDALGAGLRYGNTYIRFGTSPARDNTFSGRPHGYGKGKGGQDDPACIIQSNRIVMMLCHVNANVVHESASFGKVQGGRTQAPASCEPITLFLRRSVGYNLLVRGLSQERGDSLSYGTGLPRSETSLPLAQGLTHNKESAAHGPTLPGFSIRQIAAKVKDFMFGWKEGSANASSYHWHGADGPRL